MADKLCGKVQTVRGPVDPESLGKTLVHEHILVDYSKNFGLPSQGTSRSMIGGLTLEEQKALWEAPLSADNCGHVKHYFNQNADNMVLSDIPMMVDEVNQYKAFGGQTIVDCTVDGMCGNPAGLREISMKTGVHIVTGTGFYLARVHPTGMSDMTVEQLTDKFVKEITVGIGDTDVCAGIIGELGCTTNIHPNEKKVLQAAAKAQKETGAPIFIHPGYGVDSPSEILAILEEAQADLSRVVMCHVDRGVLKLDHVLQLARKGCWVLFDQFGWDLSFTHALSHGIDYPNDFERCRMIAELKKHGFLNQVLIAHDIAFKVRLTKYGGAGYRYILKNIAPYLLKKGFTQDDVDTLLIQNPKRVLTINGPK